MSKRILCSAFLGLLGAALAGAASGPVSVQLAFEAVAGSITVYPPRVEYDLAARRLHDPAHVRLA